MVRVPGEFPQMGMSCEMAGRGAGTLRHRPRFPAFCWTCFRRFLPSPYADGAEGRTLVRQNILHNGAALHHELHLLEHGNVIEWIAFDGD